MCKQRTNRFILIYNYKSIKIEKYPHYLRMFIKIAYELIPENSIPRKNNNIKAIFC